MASPPPPSMKDAVQFFSMPRFAVAGATNDENKFGFKILKWFLSHGLAVKGISPTTNYIKTLEVMCINSIKSFACWKPMKGASTHAGYLADLGLVIVTRPSITMELLASAEEFGCRNFWLQPGTYDDAVLERLSELKEKGYCTSAVFGPGSDSGGDWCVLIDGEDALKAGGNWDEKRVAESKEMMANLIAIKDKAIKDDEQYAKGAAVRYDKMGAFFGADEVPHRFWRSKKTPQEVRRAKARELNERNIL